MASKIFIVYLEQFKAKIKADRLFGNQDGLVTFVDEEDKSVAGFPLARLYGIVEESALCDEPEPNPSVQS